MVEDGAELFKHAIQQATEERDLASLCNLPARDAVLEELGQAFLLEVPEPPPWQCVTPPVGCWVVTEGRYGADGDHNVVVLDAHGYWRTGRRPRIDPERIWLDRTLTGADAGRPAAAVMRGDRFTRQDLREELGYAGQFLSRSDTTGYYSQVPSEVDLAAVPSRLAEALARVMHDAVERTARSAAAPPGEPSDVPTAARQLVATLLRELDAAGRPGLGGVGCEPRKGMLSRAKLATPAYPVAQRKGPKRTVRAEFHEPTVEVFIGLDGQVLTTGPLGDPIHDIDAACLLYRFAAEHHIHPRVPAAVANHRDWPEAFR